MQKSEMNLEKKCIEIRKIHEKLCNSGKLGEKTSIQNKLKETI